MRTAKGLAQTLALKAAYLLDPQTEGEASLVDLNNEIDVLAGLFKGLSQCDPRRVAMYFKESCDLIRREGQEPPSPA